VKKTLWISAEREKLVETTLNNGVKETNPVDVMKFFDNKMEDALQNGVKETHNLVGEQQLMVDDAIENGIKETSPCEYLNPNTGIFHGKLGLGIREVIDNGVKETKTPGNGDIVSYVEWMKDKSNSYTKMIDDVVDNGVKEIKTPNKDGDVKSTLEWMYKNNYQDDYNGSKMINNVIDNGIKETSHRQFLKTYDVKDTIQDGTEHDHWILDGCNDPVDVVLENGVKETQPLPDQSGELIGYGNYYHGKEDRTKAFINYLEETIKFGVKKTYWLPKEHKLPVNGVNPIDEVINEGTLI
jgi:hypothetical protein